VYVDQLWDGLSSSLGLVLVGVAGAGAIAVWRRPRAALWLLIPTVALYYLSLRGLELITLRYLLPVTVVALILAAALLADVWSRLGRGAGRWPLGLMLAAIAGLSLARAIELDRLLVTDSRYAAERWMAANLPSGARAEIYQKSAFLPRFRDGMTAELVPMAARTRAGLLERHPDVIVTSSASHKSITHTWAADWRETRTLLTPDPAAVDLLKGLESGELPYRVGAVFRQDPVLIRNRITSIAPEIVVYVPSH
jgi:hypothetical protein